MRIAIDHDDTYTRNPDMWDGVIRLMRSWGCIVICVTARQDTEENRADVAIPGVQVFFTAGSSKSWYMEQLGCKVDVWIDDSPEAVWSGRP